MPNKCCIINCKRQEDDPSCVLLNFFRIPTNAERQKAWQDSIKSYFKTEITFQSYSRICALHFNQEDFSIGPTCQRVRLKNTAVPTIFENYRLEKGSYKKENNISCRKNVDTRRANNGISNVPENCNGNSNQEIIPTKCTEAVSGVPQTPEYSHEKNNQICEKQFVFPNVSGRSEKNYEEAESIYIVIENTDSDGLNASQYYLANQPKKIKPDVFHLLVTGVVRAQLPDPSWGFHIENGKVPFVMYTKCAKLNKDGDIPTIKIKVVVFQDCEVKVYVCGKRAIIDKISTIEELEQLLLFVKNSYT